MNAYIIERDIAGVDRLSDKDLRNSSIASNAAIDQMNGRVKWMESFVLKDKTVCYYLAENEESIREHARISGFPASRIFPVAGMIGPDTANG
jgi:hypothetical protein